MGLSYIPQLVNESEMCQSAVQVSCITRKEYSSWIVSSDSISATMPCLMHSARWPSDSDIRWRAEVFVDLLKGRSSIEAHSAWISSESFRKTLRPPIYSLFQFQRKRYTYGPVFSTDVEPSSSTISRESALVRDRDPSIQPSEQYLQRMLLSLIYRRKPPWRTTTGTRE
jgi:hypothetical protein